MTQYHLFGPCEDDMRTLVYTTQGSLSILLLWSVLLTLHMEVSPIFGYSCERRKGGNKDIWKCYKNLGKKENTLSCNFSFSDCFWRFFWIYTNYTKLYQPIIFQEIYPRLRNKPKLIFLLENTIKALFWEEIKTISFHRARSVLYSLVYRDYRKDEAFKEKSFQFDFVTEFYE